MEGGARSKTTKKAEPKTMTERMARWKKARDTAGVDWKAVDAAALKGALHSIIAADCAVLFGKARGSDGVMVKVYDSGEPAQNFAGFAEEMTDLLMGLIEVWGNASEDIYAAMGGEVDPVNLAAD